MVANQWRFQQLTDIRVGVSRLEGVADALDGGLVAVHLPVASDEELAAHLEARV